jgi:quinol monooxygenase YgiN
MFARSTTVTGHPEQIEAGVAHVRDTVMPAVKEMAGCIGLSMLCDREAGRCIVTTAWADEPAMHESEHGTHALRSRTADILGGTAEVAEWEIALVHRRHEAHHGACARVIRGRIDPARIDDGVATMRMAMVPRMDDLPGFCSTSMLVNRDLGRSALTVVYDSRLDMAAAREPAQALRAEILQATGTELTDVVEYDVVLSHLRVPETV